MSAIGAPRGLKRGAPHSPSGDPCTTSSSCSTSTLADNYGAAARDRYWQILEELRAALGYVDYLGALERYRVETLHRPELLRMSSWLVDYPFAGRLYPGALSMEGRKAISDEAIAILSRPKQALDKMGEEHSALRNSDYLAIAEINNSAFLPTASASG
jgi:hypothetical protein